jgi:hypothetical protein
VVGGKREPKTKVFVSYSRKDMAFADQLEAALQARGIDPPPLAGTYAKDNRHVAKARAAPVLQ